MRYVISTDQEVEIVRLFSAGAVGHVLAEKYKVPQYRIYGILKKHGLSKYDGGRCVWASNNRAKKRLSLLGSAKTKAPVYVGSLTGEMAAAYRQHHGCAKSRQIEWAFTPDSWRDAWLGSGKWLLRGSGKYSYCMARYGDIGPYSPSNVYICTGSQNAKDMNVNTAHKLKAHSLTLCEMP